MEAGLVFTLKISQPCTYADHFMQLITHLARYIVASYTSAQENKISTVDLEAGYFIAV